MGTGPEHYGEVFAPVYDEWYSDLDDADFIAYITRCRSEQDHLRVLELGIGSGRLLESFIVARGHARDELVGIDSSASMLEQLKIRRRSLPVTTVLGDMAAALPEGPFDVVFCGYNTIFNLPDDDSLTGCLREVAHVLHRDGDFFVDMATPLAAEATTSRGPVAVSRGGNSVLISSTHDVNSQTVTGEFVHFVSPHDVRRYPWSIRYWTPAQFDELARQCGLHCVERVADGSGAPWAPHISRHISRFRVAT